MYMNMTNDLRFKAKMNKIDQFIDLTKATTYSGGVVAGLTGFLTFEQWLAVGGLVFVALNFVANLYFNWRKLQIEKQEAELKRFLMMRESARAQDAVNDSPK